MRGWGLQEGFEAPQGQGGSSCCQHSLWCGVGVFRCSGPLRRDQIPFLYPLDGLRALGRLPCGSTATGTSMLCMLLSMRQARFVVWQ